MSEFDDQFKQDVSDLVGNTALAVYRIFRSPGSVKEQDVVDEWKELTLKFLKLLEDYD